MYISSNTEAHWLSKESRVLMQVKSLKSFRRNLDVTKKKAKTENLSDASLKDSYNLFIRVT